MSETTEILAPKTRWVKTALGEREVSKLTFRQLCQVGQVLGGLPMAKYRELATQLNDAQAMFAFAEAAGDEAMARLMCVFLKLPMTPDNVVLAQQLPVEEILEVLAAVTEVNDLEKLLSGFQRALAPIVKAIQTPSPVPSGK